MSPHTICNGSVTHVPPRVLHAFYIVSVTHLSPGAFFNESVTHVSFQAFFNGSSDVTGVAYEQVNPWIGPTTDFLIKFNTKFSPCMRTDSAIERSLVRQAQEVCFVSVLLCLSFLCRFVYRFYAVLYAISMLFGVSFLFKKNVCSFYLCMSFLPCCM